MSRSGARAAHGAVAGLQQLRLLKRVRWEVTSLRPARDIELVDTRDRPHRPSMEKKKIKEEARRTYIQMRLLVQMARRSCMSILITDPCYRVARARWRMRSADRASCYPRARKYDALSSPHTCKPRDPARRRPPPARRVLQEINRRPLGQPQVGKRRSEMADAACGAVFREMSHSELISRLACSSRANSALSPMGKKMEQGGTWYVVTSQLGVPIRGSGHVFTSFGPGHRSPDRT